MSNRLGIALANSAWFAGSLPAHYRFRRALRNPAQTQRSILARLLRANAGADFGRKHAFASIKSVRDFQSAVPIQSYEEIEPWIDRIKAGERNVLTAEPVVAFEKTSGSSSAAKYIPYTRSLLREFQLAVGVWMVDLYRSYPALFAGTSYWSITPLSREPESTPGGIRVGLENDTEYFGALEQLILRRLLAVPNSVSHVADLDVCLHETCTFLLKSPNLAFISVWNPSFLTLLMEFLERHADSLLPRLRGRLTSESLWPNLKVISCWTDGASRLALPGLRKFFPNTPVQGKGLLATEGVVSVPLHGRGSALAITSHFLEFLPAGSSAPLLAHELELGREYTVIISTGGGLWRYRLGDRVRVTGFVGAVPLVEFIGREEGVCDFQGEKLHPVFVSNAIEKWRNETNWQGTFAMLAPLNGDPPCYALFADGDGVCSIDEFLCQNPHYEYCRRLGQLGCARTFRIEGNAIGTYLRHCESLGQRLGSIKPTPLHNAFGWEDVFDGEWLPEDVYA